MQKAYVKRKKIREWREEKGKVEWKGIKLWKEWDKSGRREMAGKGKGKERERRIKCERGGRRGE